MPTEIDPDRLLAQIVGDLRLRRSPVAIWRAVLDRLRDAGIPIDRMSNGNATLHPDLRAIAYRWSDDNDTIREERVAHGIEVTEAYTKSPVAALQDGRTEPIRIRLDGDDILPFETLNEVRDAGFTDYVIWGLNTHSYAVVGYIAWATRHQAGFSYDDMRCLQLILPALEIALELFVTRMTTETLLDTYLGHWSGRRVMDGTIRRGTGGSIRSVVWMSDLRDFTTLSKRLPLAALIDLVNEFFEAVIEPIHGSGGEVFKLIGDAVLAVFPIEAGDDPSEICERALAAAEGARANLARANRRRARRALEPLTAGIALHLGEVQYGNVGAPSRLDFTVLGETVNLTARLESLAGALGQPLVASHTVAAHLPHRFDALGRYPLKGFELPVDVYVPT